MPARIHFDTLSGQALPNLLSLCLHRPQRIEQIEPRHLADQTQRIQG